MQFDRVIMILQNRSTRQVQIVLNSPYKLTNMGNNRI